MDDLEKLIEETQAALAVENQEAVEAEVEDTGPSDIELQAMAQGWKPGGVKSADEFLRAGPLYEEIERRGKRIDGLEKKLEALISFQLKQEELKKKAEQDQLLEDKIQAIQNGDVAGVQAVEKKIEASNKKETPPEALDFVERHKSWWEDGSNAENVEMKNFALSRDDTLSSRGLNPTDHFKQIEKELEQLYPHRFQKANVEERKVSSVETNNLAVPTAGIKKNYGLSDLNKEQKAIARVVVDSGIMSLSDYIKDLVKLGELK